MKKIINTQPNKDKINGILFPASNIAERCNTNINIHVKFSKYFTHVIFKLNLVF